jgi:hypothetical protein
MNTTRRQLLALFALAPVAAALSRVIEPAAAPGWKHVVEAWGGAISEVYFGPEYIDFSKVENRRKFMEPSRSVMSVWLKGQGPVTISA